jgi:hypothetical protein
MRRFLGNYVPSYTPTFSKQVSSVSSSLKDQVQAKIGNLIEDPYHNTKFMKGQHQHLRKARLNDSDRLAFVICEECRELGHTRFNGCSDCASAPENTIVIAYLILGHDY